MGSVWDHSPLGVAPATRLTLGEADTPLRPAPRLGSRLGIEDLWVKDETATAVGTFKARGMALAVSARAAAPPPAFVVASPGNAGIAGAAYAALLQRPCVVLAAAGSPLARLHAVHEAGGRVVVVEGDNAVAGELAAACAAQLGWCDLTTSARRDPLHQLGTVTLGWEIAAQLPRDDRPLAVFVSVGGGNLAAGVAHGLRRAGAVLVAAQAAGCAPVVAALRAGDAEPAPWPRAATSALSIADTVPLDGAAAIAAVRESGGWGHAASEPAMHAAARWLAADEDVDADEAVGAAIDAAAAARDRLVGHRVVVVVGARRRGDLGAQPVAGDPVAPSVEAVARAVSAAV
jgi:threonine synthase